MSRSSLPKKTHRWRRRAIAVATAAFALVGLRLLPAVAEGNVPDCVRVWGEARYRNFAYDHIVHVNNGCPATALCDISTSANPTPTRVEVLPRQEIELLTFQGSPSHDFEIHAECGLVLDSSVESRASLATAFAILRE
ncbi:MAG TPA: hypothetical protein VHC69_03710 [Polyangiaceae bacterium]|nr:hypothetical protein [Polyangiaceae bacterium]